MISLRIRIVKNNDEFVEPSYYNNSSSIIEK